MCDLDENGHDPLLHSGVPHGLREHVMHTVERRIIFHSPAAQRRLHLHLVMPAVATMPSCTLCSAQVNDGERLTPVCNAASTMRRRAFYRMTCRPCYFLAMHFFPHYIFNTPEERGALQRNTIPIVTNSWRGDCSPELSGENRLAKRLSLRKARFLLHEFRR